MANVDHVEIKKARSSIVDLMRQEFENHSLGELDPYEFGKAVTPLVNSLAALALIEKQDDQTASVGEASRSDG